MKYIEKKLQNSISITGIVNLHFFEFPKDFYTESDRHPFYEIVFVSSGSLYIKSETYSGILEKNQIIIHYPNEEHSLLCTDNSSPEVIIIGFNCEGNKLNCFSNKPTTLGNDEIKNLAEIVKEGRNVFAPPFNVPTYDMKKKPDIIFGAEQILRIKLEYFLIKLLRQVINIQDENDKKDKLDINEITQYLDENFTEKVSIDELAFIFNTNRSTICKEFKKNTNKTINEYINNKKLEKAKLLLKSTNKTITQISEELNFETIHYFTRFFTKETGVSPKVYRIK